ncbi:hypothetical protein FALBO_1811 [Fusarium albosuccineum]|uniref:Zn(2)-C6 fungal-type domain-containing protein n=1 Tax=Fusarium albosuccineum TaxID=1237068 RepID=A0A8H4LNC4_9HYPO|nr:hypothetical protein FALBO_1811 [Fusarium albosuccineum]
MIPSNALANTLPRNILAQRRPRNSAPKSRANVSRVSKCKKMHLKCDEGKPECSRCQKASRGCEYPEPKQRHGRSATPQQKPILPRADATGLDLLGKLYIQPRATTLEEGEVPYFDMFRHQMAHDFAYTPCTLFWNRIIPREAMSDECVRSSVLGIGALILSLRRLGPEPLVGLSREPSDATHQLAVQYHTKAISTLHARMQRNFQTISRRNVLINMFLLFLFELLHGNTKAADRMLTSSVELLRQKKDQLVEEVNSKYPSQPQPLFTAASNDEGLDQAERILPRLQVFFSLNTPFFPLQRNCWSRLPAHPMPSSVPSVDADFVVFGGLWNSFITRAVIFVVKAMQQATTPREDALSHKRLLNHRATFLRQLREWEKVIVQRCEKETSFVQQRTIKIFHIGQKVVFILLNCCLDPTEMSYDGFEPVFRDIMTMTHSLAEEVKPVSRIETVLDIYVLPVLNFVSQKCRNRQIRQDALDTFEKMISGMGGWEARASLLARRKLMALEEQGRTLVGDIPADARYTWNEASWNESESALQVAFTKAILDEFGARGVVTMAINLSELEV